MGLAAIGSNDLASGLGKSPCLPLLHLELLHYWHTTTALSLADAERLDNDIRQDLWGLASISQTANGLQSSMLLRRSRNDANACSKKRNPDKCSSWRS